VFAVLRHHASEDVRDAIDVALRRYAEFSRAQGALSRRASIEQAKGILMQRHGITADEAFARLRRQARDRNSSLFDVAEAVLMSYPLFRSDDGEAPAASPEPGR
jgi:response regulator NasT